MPYPFKQIFAVDENDPQMVAADAEVLLFEPGDTSRTPLVITDPSGIQLQNPVRTNEHGFGPAFIALIPQVAWEGAGLTGFLESYEGLRDVAVQAVADLETIGAQMQESVNATLAEANDAATAARDAANLVDTPADEAIATALQAQGSQASAALSAATAIVNVRHHGAKGDGVTDDKDAVDRAIAELDARGGGTLYFPPGEYWWSRIVTLKSNLHITGDGATIRKRSSADINYALFISQSNGSKGYGSGLKNLRVSGLKFKGSFAADGKTACAFGLHHADQVLIEHCVFEEMQGTGHIVDLNGCSNITIRDCQFIGSKNEGGGYGRSEAIQLDISNAGSTSGPDDAASFDWLPTINVAVENCKFLPLTKDGTTYPAPNPLGSHAMWENAWHENIAFTNNLVVDPYQDTASTTPGVLHFVTTRNIRIRGNTFRCTTPRTMPVLAFYSLDRGQSLNNPGGGTYPYATITPMQITDVWIESNSFEGFGALSANPLITVNPLSGSTNVRAVNVNVSDNKMAIKTGTGGTNFVDCRYVDGLSINRNVFTGQGRPVNVVGIDRLRVDGNQSVGARADAVNATECVSPTFTGNTFKASAGSSFWIGASTDVNIQGNQIVGTVAGARAIAFSACTRIGVSGNNIQVPSGTRGIEVYNTTVNGYIRNNIVHGGTTTHVVNAGTGITVEQNSAL